MNVRDALALPEGTLFTGSCCKCGEIHQWALRFQKHHSPDMDLSDWPLQYGQESIRVVWAAPKGKQMCGLPSQYAFTHSMIEVVV